MKFSSISASIFFFTAVLAGVVRMSPTPDDSVQSLINRILSETAQDSQLLQQKQKQIDQAAAQAAIDAARQSADEMANRAKSQLTGAITGAAGSIAGGA